VALGHAITDLAVQITQEEQLIDKNKNMIKEAKIVLEADANRLRNDVD
jgi:hypothetical protein